MIPLPPTSTLFPYTTLFRSLLLEHRARGALRGVVLGEDVRVADVSRDQRIGLGSNLLGNRERLRSEEHTSELQSHSDLVCRLLLEKKKNKFISDIKYKTIYT